MQYCVLDLAAGRSGELLLADSSQPLLLQMTEYPRGGVAANAPAAPTAAITAAANILLRASRGQSSHIRAGRHKPVAAMTATDLGFYFGGRVLSVVTAACTT